MRKANEDIRKHARERGILLWMVAEKCGMRDTNFSKLLRHELADDKKTEIMEIIDELAGDVKWQR